MRSTRIRHLAASSAGLAIAAWSSGRFSARHERWGIRGLRLKIENGINVR